jgi:zona occludens toxin
MECPPGSIIVIDEAQKIFRNRSLGTLPGPHVTELEEHRHRGIDMYLITQHPSLIDPAVRRLSGVHRHMIRIFGMEASTVHKWSAVVDTPDKSHCRKDSEKERWAFDKSLYGLYKSAEVHTMKRSIPLKLWLVLAAPFALGLAGWWVYHSTVGKHDKAPVTAQAKTQAANGRKVVSVSQAAPSNSGERKPTDAIADAKEYVFLNTPRVEGLAHTAPKYDELTKPVRVPVPAACIQFRGTCKCLTQQGTPMDVKPAMCVEFARNGFFQEFDADGDRKDVERGLASSKMLDDRVRGTERHAGGSGSQVVVFDKVASDVPQLPASTAKKGG